MSTMEKKPIRSKIWDWFTKQENYMATCSLCGQDYCHRTSSSNLFKHLFSKHKLSKEKINETSLNGNPLLIEDTDFDEEQKPLRSMVWDWFRKQANYMARCSLCGQDYSYKTTTSNLVKHLVIKHKLSKDTINETSFNGNPLDEDTDFDDEYEESSKERKFRTRRYFELTEDDRLSRCKLCLKSITHDSVAELIRHIIEHHGDCGDGSDIDGNPESKPRTRSMLWLYFKPNSGTKTATCLICRDSVSYEHNNSTLRQHMQSQHPTVQTGGDGGDNKKILITADGDLYEIETETVENTENHSKDPIHMDTVYLEDLENTDVSDKPVNRQQKRPFKKKTREIPHVKKNKSIQESSSDDEMIVRNKKRRSLSKENGRIDLFGQYLVTLLKELPRRLSDELQANMIKQVMTAKINYELQSETNKFNVPKSPITESVTNIQFSVVNGVTDT